MQRRIACITAILLCAINAYADGIYIPNYQAKPPTIPSQRAIIVYKDGIERLQVESMVQSEGTSLAWILPVPATPISVVEASPGFMKTLVLNTPPELRGPEGLRKGYVLAKLVAAVLALWSIWALIGAKSFRAALFPLFLATIPCIVFEWYQEEREATLAGAPERPVVHVERHQVVGNYEVAVLDAPNGKALDSWLKRNGFIALPAKGQEVANDYVREGWRFVAAKLRTEGGKLLRPHPLEITFPTKQLVYPMRLTALANSDVFVQLFVGAAKEAKSDLLATQLVGELHQGTEKYDGKYSIKFGDKRGFRLSHPDTLNYFWLGCIVTRLEGTIREADMDDDITLKLVTPHLRRTTVRTFEARRIMVATRTLLVWAFCLAPLVLAAGLMKTSVRRRKGTACALLATTAIAAASGYAYWNSIPVQDAVKILPKDMRSERDHWLEGGTFVHLQFYAKARPDFAQLSPEEQVAAIRNVLNFVPTFNRTLGGPIRLEDSPNNLLAEVRNNKVTLIEVRSDGSFARQCELNDTEDVQREYNRWKRTPYQYEGDAKALEAMFHNWKRNYSPHALDPLGMQVLCAVEHSPQLMAGPVVTVVEQAINGEATPEYVLEVAVGSLGLATKTVPPPDLTDRDALKAFLVQVKSQLQSHAASSPPGG